MSYLHAYRWNYLFFNEFMQMFTTIYDWGVLRCDMQSTETGPALFTMSNTQHQQSGKSDDCCVSLQNIKFLVASMKCWL